jgi:hypothetical protein
MAVNNSAMIPSILAHAIMIKPRSWRSLASIWNEYGDRVMAKKPLEDGDAAKIRDETLKRAFDAHKPHKTKPKPRKKVQKKK